MGAKERPIWTAPACYGNELTSEQAPNPEALKMMLQFTKPDELAKASGELAEVHGGLSELVTALNTHLKKLDNEWTVGDDAKEVKKQLRRVLGTAQNVSTAIMPIGPQPTVTKETGYDGFKGLSGVAPALGAYGTLLAKLRGDIPAEADGAEWYEGMAQGALMGAGGGAVVGSVVPVIGTGIGALVGGIGGAIGGWIHAGLTEIPLIGNWFGDSKEEKEKKAVQQVIDEANEATASIKNGLPRSVTVDLPEWAGKLPTTPQFPGVPPSPGPGPSPNAFHGPGSPGFSQTGGLDAPGINGLDEVNGEHPFGQPGNTAGLDGGGLPPGTEDWNKNGPYLDDVKVPDAGDLGNVPNGETQLADFNPAGGLPTGASATGLPGSLNGAGGFGAGAGLGSGAGQGMAAGMSAARALSGTGMGGMMVPPLAGGAGSNKDGQEHSSPYGEEDWADLLGEEPSVSNMIDGRSRS